MMMIRPKFSVHPVGKTMRWTPLDQKMIATFFDGLDQRSSKK